MPALGTLRRVERVADLADQAHDTERLIDTGNTIENSVEITTEARGIDKVNNVSPDVSSGDVKLIDYIPGDRRNLPGAASHGGDLPHIVEGQSWLKGSHGNAGKIPSHIAEKLSGRQYNTFDDFRADFWTEVGNDPILSKQFNTGNIKLMKKGQAPVAVDTQQAGKRIKYELDHDQEIQDGGNVYDMNNLVIRTPLNHIKGK